MWWMMVLQILRVPKAGNMDKEPDGEIALVTGNHPMIRHLDVLGS